MVNHSIVLLLILLVLSNVADSLLESKCFPRLLQFKENVMFSKVDAEVSIGDIKLGFVEKSNF